MSPAKGELYRLALVSAEETIKVTSAIVPDPIVGKNKGCSVEIISLMPKFELAMLKGAGFSPNEEVAFFGDSFGETHERKAKADLEGRFDMAVLPFVKGKLGGEMEVALKGGRALLLFPFIGAAKKGEAYVVSDQTIEIKDVQRPP
jgi:hypothetical protein